MALNWRLRHPHCLPNHVHGGSQLRCNVCSQSHSRNWLGYRLGRRFSLTVKVNIHEGMKHADNFLFPSEVRTLRLNNSWVVSVFTGIQLPYPSNWLNRHRATGFRYDRLHRWVRHNFAIDGVNIDPIILRLSLGPPLGGALYARFGFRGPFIFGIAVSFLDLLGRCFIIERKDSLKWGFDPHIVERNAGSEPRVEPPSESGEAVEKSRGESEGVATNNGEEKANNPLPTTSQPEVLEETSTTPKHLPLIVVIAKLCREPRAIAASFIILLYG